MCYCSSSLRRHRSCFCVSKAFALAKKKKSQGTVWLSVEMGSCMRRWNKKKSPLDNVWTWGLFVRCLVLEGSCNCQLSFPLLKAVSSQGVINSSSTKHTPSALSLSLLRWSNPESRYQKDQSRTLSHQGLLEVRSNTMKLADLFICLLSHWCLLFCCFKVTFSNAVHGNILMWFHTKATGTALWNGCITGEGPFVPNHYVGQSPESFC